MKYIFLSYCLILSFLDVCFNVTLFISDSVNLRKPLFFSFFKSIVLMVYWSCLSFQRILYKILVFVCVCVCFSISLISDLICIICSCQLNVVLVILHFKILYLHHGLFIQLHQIQTCWKRWRAHFYSQSPQRK